MSSSSIQPGDLDFLVALAGASSLTGAAREMGVSKAAASKRLAALEARTGVLLLQRTTRRMSLTPEGAAAVAQARRVLDGLEELDRQLRQARERPRGLLRVNATLGFGRNHVGPLISRFLHAFPEVEVQLHLSAQPPALTDDAFDVAIRFGEPPEARVIARRLAPNRRLLCAAPAYLARHGSPAEPAELRRHACIDIRQGGETHGIWRLAQGSGSRRRQQAVRIRGALATNDGEVAVQWALDGHGILMRAEWDIHDHLAAGRLLPVLTHWQTPSADIHAVVPARLQTLPRVRAFVDFAAAAFAKGGVPRPPG